MKSLLYILLSVCFITLTACTKDTDDLEVMDTTTSIIVEDIVVN